MGHFELCFDKSTCEVLGGFLGAEVTAVPIKQQPQKSSPEIIF